MALPRYYTGLYATSTHEIMSFAKSYA